MKISSTLKSTLVISLIAVGALFGLTSQASAISCEDSCDDKSEGEKLSCLNDVRQACEEKLSEVSEKKQTLQNAIAYFDTQIAYTQSKINETAFQIKQLEGEIESLSGKISKKKSSRKYWDCRRNSFPKRQYRTNRRRKNNSCSQQPRTMNYATRTSWIRQQPNLLPFKPSLPGMEMKQKSER